MLDLSAPVVPGHSAGGYQIGMPIDAVLAEDGHLFRHEPLLGLSGQPTNTTRYSSANLDLWVVDGAIEQIGVHGAYSGKLPGEDRTGHDNWRH